MALDREKKLWHEQMVVWHKQNIVACNQQIEYLKGTIEANKKFLSAQIQNIRGQEISLTPNANTVSNRTARMSLLDKMVITQENIIKWHNKQIEFHCSIVKW